MNHAYVLDFFHSAQHLRREIEHFILHDARGPQLFPQGVPTLVDCAIIAIEVFEAMFESQLHWHESSGNAWPRVDAAVNRLTPPAPEGQVAAMQFSEHPDYAHFEDEVLLSTLFNTYWDFLHRFLKERRWHRYELRRAEEVKSHARFSRTPTVITIVDLGDHRILHYHETMDSKTNQRTATVKDPVHFAFHTRQLEDRAVTFPQYLVTDDPTEVNAIAQTLPSLMVMEVGSNGELLGMKLREGQVS